MTNKFTFNQRPPFSFHVIVEAARALFAFGLAGAAVSGVISAAIGFALLHRAGAIDGLLFGALIGFEIAVLGIAIGGKWGACTSGAIIGYLGGAFGVALYDVGGYYSIQQTVEWALQSPVSYLFGACGVFIARFAHERLAPVLLRYRSRSTSVAPSGAMPPYQISLPVRLAIAVAEMAPVAATIAGVLRHMQVV